MKHESYLARFVKSHRSGLILPVLVIEMLVLRRQTIIRTFAQCCRPSSGVIIVAATNSMASRQFVRWVVLPLAGVWGLASLEALAGPDYPCSHLTPLAGLALSCSILWGIFERLHRVARRPGTALAESLIAYLVIAIAFAQLYWILNRIVTRPFNRGPPHAAHQYPAVLSMATISRVG